MTAGRKRRKGKVGRRLMGALAFAAGAVGTALIVRRRTTKTAVKERQSALDYLSHATPDRWARPGMDVTFRAELKPGRDRSERTFRVKSLLPSGRVTLEGAAGEHAETEFEPLR